MIFPFNERETLKALGPLPEGIVAKRGDTKIWEKLRNGWSGI